MAYSQFVAYHLEGNRVLFGLKDRRNGFEEVYQCYEVDSQSLRKRIAEVFPDYIDKRMLRFGKNGHQGSAAEGLQRLLIKERHEPRLLADIPARAVAFKDYEWVEDLTDTMDGRLLKEYGNLCRHRILIDELINESSQDL
jgi:hypothetical protein